MRKALIKAGNEPGWLVFKNEGHGYYEEENRTKMLAELEAFLAANIGT